MKLNKKQWILVITIILLLLLIQHYVYFNYREGFWILGVDTREEDGNFSRGEYGFKHNINEDYRLWFSFDKHDYDIVFFYECEPYWNHMARTDQCDIALNFFPSPGILLETIQYDKEDQPIINIYTFVRPGDDYTEIQLPTALYHCYQYGFYEVSTSLKDNQLLRQFRCEMK